MRTRRPGAGALARPEVVDDEERWLWRLVDDGDRALANAPTAPPRAAIAAAKRFAADASLRHRRANDRRRHAELALSRLRVRLRRRLRAQLSEALLRAHLASASATKTRAQAENTYQEMNSRLRQRREYLAAHREVLARASRARRDLDRRIDDLIATYAEAPEPPAWFRYGVGNPPGPDSYPQWLDRARAAVAYRRRHGVAAQTASVASPATAG
jgi:hypothetical protein